MMFMIDILEYEKFMIEMYYEKLNICNLKKNFKCLII